MLVSVTKAKVCTVFPRFLEDTTNHGEMCPIFKMGVGK